MDAAPGMFFRIFERKQVHLPETYGIMVARRGIIQRQYDGLQNRSREFESLFPCEKSLISRAFFIASVLFGLLLSRPIPRQGSLHLYYAKPAGQTLV